MWVTHRPVDTASMKYAPIDAKRSRGIWCSRDTVMSKASLSEAMLTPTFKGTQYQGATFHTFDIDGIPMQLFSFVSCRRSHTLLTQPIPG